jgi:hypothetical protein
MEIPAHATAVAALQRLAGHGAQLNDMQVPKLFGRGEAIDAIRAAATAAAHDAEASVALLRDAKFAPGSIEAVERGAGLLRDLASNPITTDSTRSTGAHIIGIVDDVMARQQSIPVASVTTPSQSHLLELERILAKPNSRITKDDLRQLADIEHLPSDVRPDLPEVRYSFADLSEKNWLPSNDSDAHATFTRVRTHFEREHLLNDPQITKESAGNEIQRILAKPNSAITQTDLRRLALLESLPSDRRPKLPDLRYSFADLSEKNWLPSNDSDAQATFATMRSWVMVDTEAGQRQLRESIASGDDIPARIMEQLLDDPDLIARVGLPIADLLPRSLDAVRAAPEIDRSDARTNMHTLDRILEQMRPRDGREKKMIEDSQKLLQRNIDRTGYIDYAEIAQAVTNIDMMLTMREGNAAAVPARSAEVVNW